MSDQKQMMTYTGPIPDGWELTGEMRPPKKGDYFINFRVLPKQTHPSVEQCESIHETTCPVIIVRRKRWRPKNGENYWAIEIGTDGGSGVTMKRFCNDSIDVVPNNGNCFATYEEAIKVSHKFLQMMRDHQHEMQDNETINHACEW